MNENERESIERNDINEEITTEENGTRLYSIRKK